MDLQQSAIVETQDPDLVVAIIGSVRQDFQGITSRLEPESPRVGPLNETKTMASIGKMTKMGYIGYIVRSQPLGWLCRFVDPTSRGYIRMRKRRGTMVLGFASVFFAAGLGIARAQPDPTGVQRFADPTPSLASADAQTVQEALSIVLDELKTSSEGVVSFADQQALANFLAAVRNRINAAYQGRSPQTRSIGNAALQTIDRIRAAGTGAPRVDSDLLVELAQQAANLLATVVFEGPRIPYIASPQAVPAPMPQAPTKSQPASVPVGYAPATGQAGPG
jgi:hypothetical protein